MKSFLFKNQKTAATSAKFAANNRGYTLLFSVLVATIVLGVAVFIVDVSRKQYELSVAARNSIYSFYAADSGIECAVNSANWTNPDGFASTTGGTLTCGSGTMTLTSVGVPSIYPASIITGNAANPIRQQTGYISLNYSGGGATVKPCAQLTFTTGINPVTSEPMTIVDSRGYNLCVESPSVLPDISNPGTVERALRLQQKGVW